MAVAVHELIEAILCRHRGIKEKDVTKFDLMFEEEIKAGKQHKHPEPGFDPRAPYRHEHAFATVIERTLIKELGIFWEEYDEIIDNLKWINQHSQ